MFVFVFSAHNWLLNKEIQLYFSDLACSTECLRSTRDGCKLQGCKPAGFEGKQTRINWTAAVSSVSPQSHHHWGARVWQFNSGWVWLWCSRLRSPKGVHPFSKLVQCKLWRSKYRKRNIYHRTEKYFYLLWLTELTEVINNHEGQSQKSRYQSGILAMSYK